MIEAWAQWQYRMDTICTPGTQGETSCERLGRMEKISDAEWVIMARDAFLAQIEYGWGAVRIEKGPWCGAWYVGCMNEIDYGEWVAHAGNRYPDPVAALSAAYRWKKASRKSSDIPDAGIHRHR